MYQKIIFLFFLFFISAIAIAQSPFPTSPSGAVGAPIDGGISLLLAAGAAYGAKKVYEFRNKDESE
ncbi:hypothetical protein Fleli_3943 [Bernardetia litoralis DSM 6794]|uniref:Uncharacterized protein n=1 Tax=Bernardetia litoralis (strain ATCC 23117 / DSM 6794 / NBRC 15988 / NCIMB 1366 / Fx l1 / Sio-4) TaxID=880071 RepID=I4AQL0_BERLS|nr:hypothetical protein [Bernardetia litoralis]AFM06245.1 hypothetical protein Fleli_3943 [Bernardetia litoralis DSM 6794]